ncbi:solute carrier family 49 member A3-like [Pollicipes pollicipes]|uniref:solute carrier family 49 member A3-like n=1 Tax=Pollicipes pollicipes TaxID=41117 RepID=UPI0018855540|nr:solute carrier family 49 member A3-like [Pollicipes pollicipes]
MPVGEGAAPVPVQPYRVYRRRWLVLFVIVVTQVSNGAAWLSFSPVASYAAHYYDTTLDNINWQMTQFMIVQLIVTPFIMWAVDHWSFRWVVVIGAVLNGLGMAVKGISTWDLVTPTHLRYALTMVGSVAAAVAQPFTLVIPTRYSQAWHPQGERTLSTTLSSLANPIGCMLGISVTPLYVTKPADVPLINTIWAFPAIIAALAAIFGVTMSHPPTPPSPSAAHCRRAEPFWRTMRTLLTSRPLLILACCFGPAIGAMNGVATLLGQMLCTTGYSTGFVGLCGALLFGCGIPGAILLGLIAMKTGKAVETVKISYSMTAVCLIIFCQAARYPDLQWLLALSIGLVGLVGVGTYPLAIELGVEATYPIDQTYSNSLIFIPGSLVGAVLVVLGTAMGRPISPAAQLREVCTVDGAAGAVQPLDYTNYYILMTSLISVSAVGFTLLFDTPYHRSNRDAAGSPSDTEPVVDADTDADADSATTAVAAAVTDGPTVVAVT